MANLNAGTIAALCVVLFSLLITIISLSTSYWATTTISINGVETETRYGLWTACACIGDRPCICGSFESVSSLVPDYIKACEAAMILSMFGLLGGAVTWGIWLTGATTESRLKVLRIVTIILILIAFFWDMIAVIVFAAKEQNDLKEAKKRLPPGGTVDNKFGWSWGFAILAAILDLAGAGLVAFSLPNKTV